MSQYKSRRDNDMKTRRRDSDDEDDDDLVKLKAAALKSMMGPSTDDKPDANRQHTVVAAASHQVIEENRIGVPYQQPAAAQLTVPVPPLAAGAPGTIPWLPRMTSAPVQLPYPPQNATPSYPTSYLSTVPAVQPPLQVQSTMLPASVGPSQFYPAPIVQQPPPPTYRPVQQMPPAHFTQNPIALQNNQYYPHGPGFPQRQPAMFTQMPPREVYSQRGMPMQMPPALRPPMNMNHPPRYQPGTGPGRGMDSRPRFGGMIRPGTHPAVNLRQGFNAGRGSEHAEHIESLAVNKGNLIVIQTEVQKQEEQKAKAASADNSFNSRPVDDRKANFSFKQQQQAPSALLRPQDRWALSNQAASVEEKKEKGGKFDRYEEDSASDSEEEEGSENLDDVQPATVDLPKTKRTISCGSEGTKETEACDIDGSRIESRKVGSRTELDRICSTTEECKTISDQKINTLDTTASIHKLSQFLPSAKDTLAEGKATSVATTGGSGDMKTEPEVSSVRRLSTGNRLRGRRKKATEISSSSDSSISEDSSDANSQQPSLPGAEDVKPSGSAIPDAKPKTVPVSEPSISPIVSILTKPAIGKSVPSVLQVSKPTVPISTKPAAGKSAPVVPSLTASRLNTEPASSSANKILAERRSIAAIIDTKKVPPVYQPDSDSEISDSSESEGSTSSGSSSSESSDDSSMQGQSPPKQGSITPPSLPRLQQSNKQQTVSTKHSSNSSQSRVVADKSNIRDKLDPERNSQELSSPIGYAKTVVDERQRKRSNSKDGNRRATVEQQRAAKSGISEYSQNKQQRSHDNRLFSRKTTEEASLRDVKVPSLHVQREIRGNADASLREHCSHNSSSSSGDNRRLRDFSEENLRGTASDRQIRRDIDRHAGRLELESSYDRSGERCMKLSHECEDSRAHKYDGERRRSPSLRRSASVEARRDDYASSRDERKRNHMRLVDEPYRKSDYRVENQYDVRERSALERHEADFSRKGRTYDRYEDGGARRAGSASCENKRHASGMLFDAREAVAVDKYVTSRGDNYRQRRRSQSIEQQNRRDRCGRSSIERSYFSNYIQGDDRVGLRKDAGYDLKRRRDGSHDRVPERENGIEGKRSRLAVSPGAKVGGGRYERCLIGRPTARYLETDASGADFKISDDSEKRIGSKQMKHSDSEKTASTRHAIPSLMEGTGVELPRHKISPSNQTSTRNLTVISVKHVGDSDSSRARKRTANSRHDNSKSPTVSRKSPKVTSESPKVKVKSVLSIVSKTNVEETDGTSGMPAAKRSRADERTRRDDVSQRTPIKSNKKDSRNKPDELKRQQCEESDVESLDSVPVTLGFAEQEQASSEPSEEGTSAQAEDIQSEQDSSGLTDSRLKQFVDEGGEGSEEESDGGEGMRHPAAVLSRIELSAGLQKSRGSSRVVTESSLSDLGPKNRMAESNQRYAEVERAEVQTRAPVHLRLGLKNPAPAYLQPREQAASRRHVTMDDSSVTDLRALIGRREARTENRTGQLVAVEEASVGDASQYRKQGRSRRLQQ